MGFKLIRMICSRPIRASQATVQSYTCEMPMRWLTREALTGDLSNEEEDERWRQWTEARRAIRSRLHSGAERLLDTNVHDGVIDSLRQLDSDLVELRALIGDNQVGYEWLFVRYRGASLTIVEPGFGTGAGTAYEMLRDELAVAIGYSFVHSVITWPQGEFDIEFTAVDVTRTPGSSDERADLFARAEIPTPPG